LRRTTLGALESFFLALLPITAAFCLAYPKSGFLVWHADGGGWFETPLPLAAKA
jgi:hypothetical protein